MKKSKIDPFDILMEFEPEDKRVICLKEHEGVKEGEKGWHYLSDGCEDEESIYLKCLIIWDYGKRDYYSSTKQNILYKFI